MPPFVNRKRRESSSPPPPQVARKRQRNDSSANKQAQPRAVRAPAKKSKATVFDLVDKPQSSKGRTGNSKFADVQDSDSSSDSNDDSDNFEDVVPEAPNKTQGEASEDEGDWEDALNHAQDKAEPAEELPEGPTETLELTLTERQPEFSFVDLTGKKQGPSKKDRLVREVTHKMHVQLLMWHNHRRNIWLNDEEVQKTMVAHLHQSQKMKLQLESWKRKSGIPENTPRKKPIKESPKSARGKGKGRQAKEDPRSKRDWADPAERQAAGQPDLSRGDPILPLLNTMAAWWRQRFTITAPGLRKRGYKPMRVLKEEVRAWRNGETTIAEHGERIASLGEFRSCARRCEGSRDVGAQLFAALLRGLGVEARLVASLQPLGFGWTKAEEADPKKNQKETATNGQDKSDTGNEKRKPNTIKKPSASTAPIEVSDTSDLSEIGSSDVDSDASIVDITPKKKANMPYDNDMVYPTYWIEAVSSVTNRVFPVDPFILRPAVATSAEHLTLFETRGAKAEKAKQVFAYVVAFSPDLSAKDVTTRYLKKHMWPGRTKGFRMPPQKVSIRDPYGKVLATYEVDWWQRLMCIFQRPFDKRTAADELEEEAELRPVQPEKKAAKEGDPDTLNGYKQSEKFVLERHLRREEALVPGAKQVKTFKTGKGEKATEEPVYLRKDVVICRTSESWHKEGRQIRRGQQPLKMVRVRAVTTNRKREIEEAERESGEKAMQGMYSKEQTEWIIPEPIKDGVIPKNAFGNMDAFVPQMIPRGAVHLPMRGTKRVCTKLGIDFAEAVTGFEFGNRMAVPVIEGVVVAEEHTDLVIDAWNKAEEERKIREAAKREKEILTTWRKFFVGLRILDRMKAEYEINIDDDIKERNPFTNRKKEQAEREESPQSEPAMNGHVQELDENDIAGGGFLHEEDEEGGGFIPEGRNIEIRDRAKHGKIEKAAGNEIEIEHEDEAKAAPIPRRGKAKSLAELAAQQAADQEPDSEPEPEPEPEPIEPTPGKKTSNKQSKATGSTKKSVKKATQTKTKGRGRVKSKPEPVSPSGGEVDQNDDDDDLSELSSDEASQSEANAQNANLAPPPRPTSTRSTRVSARSAAKASQQKIRSHYFEDQESISDYE